MAIGPLYPIAISLWSGRLKSADLVDDMPSRRLHWFSDKVDRERREYGEGRKGKEDGNQKRRKKVSAQPPKMNCITSSLST
jgi:hypothetical protein